MPTNTITTQLNQKVTGAGATSQLNQLLSDLNRTLTKSNAGFNRVSSSARKTQREVSKLSAVQRQLNNGLKAFVTFNISRALTNIATSTVSTINEFQRLDRVLQVTTGQTASEVERTFQGLVSIAADLPESSTDVVNAFVRLNNLNLDNSADALRDFSDLSAGLGRNLDRLIEAVADSATFEFERLKEEFGIIARQTDETIRFTFQGTTTEVEKTASAVQDFIRTLAQENFKGAAEAQLDTLGASFNNLGDAINQSIRKIDDNFSVSSGIASSINNFSRSIRFASGTKGLRDLRLEAEEARETALSLQDALRQNLTGTELRDAVVNSFGTAFENLGQSDTNRRLNAEKRIVEELERERKLRAEIVELQELQASITITDRTTGAVQTLANIAFGFDKIAAQSKGALGPVKDFELTLKRLEEGLAANGNADILNTQVFKAEVDSAREAAVAAQDAIDIRAAQSKADQLQKLINGSLTEANRGILRYQETINKLNEAQVSTLVNSRQVIGAAQQQLLNDALKFIGDATLNDGTLQAERAFQERYQRLEEVVKTYGQDLVDQIGLTERLAIDQVKLRDKELADALQASQTALLSPTETVFRQLNQIANRFAGGNAGSIQGLQQNTLDKFLQSFTLDAGVIKNLSDFNDELNRTFVNFSAQGLNVDQAKINSIISFVDSVLGGNSNGQPQTSLDQFNQRIEAINRLGEFALNEDQEKRRKNLILQNEREIFEIKRSSSEQLLSLIANEQTRALALEQAGSRAKVVLALDTGQKLLSGFTEQSEGILRISKALAATQVSIDLFRAITGFKSAAASAGGGLIGFLSAAAQVGSLIAEFKGYIDEIESKELGDSSVSGGGGGSSINYSSLRSEVQPRGNNNANLSINVFGSVLDEGGLEEAIAEGARNALDNDRLIIRNTDIRRF